MQAALRQWITAATLVLAHAVAGATAADAGCGAADAQGVQRCRSGLPAAVVQTIAASQERPNWCWAAALSIVFAHNGYAVPQREIVERIAGSARDMRITAREFAELINRDWFAADGRRVAAATTPRAPGQGNAPEQLKLLVESIERGQPVLLAGRGHVVVLVGLVYERQGDSIRVVSGTVVDPWPTAGVRPLDLAELEVSFAARVDVRAREDRQFVSVLDRARSAQ